MRQIRAKASGRRSSRHSMAVNAGIPLKYSFADQYARIFDSRSLLGANPRSKLLRPIHRNAEEHFRVLCSAVLCTLPQKDTGSFRVHPHSVGMVRDEVGLTCKLRHPKAVVSIG